MCIHIYVYKVMFIIYGDFGLVYWFNAFSRARPNSKTPNTFHKGYIHTNARTHIVWQQQKCGQRRWSHRFVALKKKTHTHTTRKTKQKNTKQQMQIQLSATSLKFKSIAKSKMGTMRTKQDSKTRKTQTNM